MVTSHSKQELDTSDALSRAQKTHELEDIVKLLQAMENQHMRFIHIKYSRQFSCKCYKY